MVRYETKLYEVVDAGRKTGGIRVEAGGRKSGTHRSGDIKASWTEKIQGPVLTYFCGVPGHVSRTLSSFVGTSQEASRITETHVKMISVCQGQLDVVPKPCNLCSRAGSSATLCRKRTEARSFFLQNQLPLEPPFLLSGFRFPRAPGCSFTESAWLQIWTYFDMLTFGTLYDWISCHRRHLLSSGDKLARSPLFFFKGVTCQLLLGRIEALKVCVVRIFSRHGNSIGHGVGVLEILVQSSSNK